MWILVVLALFSNGKLKGPSQSYTPAHAYDWKAPCEAAAAAFNSIDFVEDAAPSIHLRAFCTPSPKNAVD